MAGEKAFQYTAYISFVQSDENFAKKLQKNLERYNLPVTLSRQFPRSIRCLRPVFGSSPNIGENDNSRNEIRERMKRAKYLIVICSEHAALSNSPESLRLEAEVQDFIAANPEENRFRVIPIIVREKGGARATACLPTSVKLLDVLALDVLDKGYRQVFNQVVSRMVGIKPGILWRSRSQATQREMLCTALLSFATLLGIVLSYAISTLIGVPVAVALMASCLFIVWRNITPYVVCYERYSERNNLPVGYGKLRQSECTRKTCHYRFTYQRFRLRKVECCNSSGVPTTEKSPGFFHDEVSSREIKYNEAGKVDQQIWKNEHGEVLRVVQYESSAEDDWMTFRSPGGDYAMSHYLHKTSGTNSSVTRYSLERDAKGYVTAVNFRNDAGNPCCDWDGSWGIQYEIDSSKGVILAWYYLDKDGMRMANRFGISGYRYVYDASEHLVQSDNVDLAGNSCFCQNGYASKSYSIDEWGNRIAIAYLDTQGKLCLNARLVAKVLYNYDEQGFLISEDYLDENERPCLNSAAVSRCVFERDDVGCLVSVSYYDDANQPCAGTQLYHREIRMSDSYGNCCISTYYDEQGERCCNADGISRQLNRYDEEGRCCSHRFYNREDAPCCHKNGYHYVTFDCDEYGNVCIESYFDAADQPCRNRDGIARIVREYDSHNNCIHESYYAPDCTPCIHLTSRIAAISRSYDASNNVIREQYHGLDGEPCSCNNGYVTRIWEYDGAGRLLTAEYRDIDDELCDNEKGYAGEYWVYDKYGNVTKRSSCDFSGIISEEEYRDYDERGLLIRRYFTESRFSSTKDDTVYVYDNRRNLIRESYYDSAGNAYADRDSGVAECRYEYDSRNRKIAEEYYGIDGLRCCNHLKFSRLETEYDKRDLPVSLSYFGIDGQPCRYQDAFVRIEMMRDGNGRITQIRQWRGENEFDSEVNYEYDAEGNVLVWRFCDEFSDPATVAGRGISYLVNSYDEHNEKVSESYYDEQGNPCRDRISKVAGIKWVYDSLRRMCGVLFFDEKGAPCICSGGYARRVIYYGEDGNVSKEEYYDIEGRLCIECVDYSRVVVEPGLGTGIYESNIYPDKLITSEFFAPGILNCSYKLRRFDGCGNLRGVECYDEAGKMYADHSGELYTYDDRNASDFAEVHVSYDANGHETCEEYLNWEGDHCVPCWRSYASKEAEYDDAGRLLSLTFSNESAELIVAEEYGFAQKELEYDEDGRLVQEAFYDDCGSRCDAKEGYALRVLAYDDKGRLISDAFYDSDEEWCPVKNGPTRRKLRYDSRDRLVSEEYIIPAPKNLGIRELVAWEMSICAGKRYVYDEAGRLITEEYHDADGELCLYYEGGGFARKSVEYNGAGQILQEIYYDENEEIIKIRKCSYDETALLVSEDFVDSEGELMDGPDDYARRVLSYDSHGNCISVEYYDSDGELRHEYTEEKGELPARSEYVYDAKGRLIYESHHCPDGSLSSIKDTGNRNTGKIGREYASVSYTYSNDGSMKPIAHYYDVGEIPTSHDMTDFDSRRKEIIKRYSVARPNERFEYQAFISYSSKDVSFANKLQKYLESYILPNYVNKQHPRPIRTLVPIFRDRTDLEQGNLGEMLLRGLRASKYLLVICSENSAQPNSHGKRYVDIEVNSFTSLNPETYRNRIIPIILREEGTTVEECLPPAIKKLNLDFIDALLNKHTDVGLKIAAKMMNLNPEILQNERKRNMKNYGSVLILLFVLIIIMLADVCIVTQLLAAICMSLLGGICFYAAWQKWKPVKTYYQHYVEEYNMPIGIDRLTRADVAKKSAYSVFTYKNGVLRNVTHYSAEKNAEKAYIPGFISPPEIISKDIFYDELGLVNRQLWYDAAGTLVREVLFESGKLNDWMTFRTPGNKHAASHPCADTLTETKKVTRYRLKRNQNGHIVEVMYCNDTGVPCADADGVWGLRYDINVEQGCVNSLHFIDKNGETIRNDKGIAGHTYRYDEQGELINIADM